MATDVLDVIEAEAHREHAVFEWLDEVGREWMSEIEERGTPITKPEMRALRHVLADMRRSQERFNVIRDLLASLAP